MAHPAKENMRSLKSDSVASINLKEKIFMTCFRVNKTKPPQDVTTPLVGSCPKVGTCIDSQTILGCCGPGEQPVSGIFSKYVLRNSGTEGRPGGVQLPCTYRR